MKKRIRRYAFHVGHWTLRVSRWTFYASVVLLVVFTIVFVSAYQLLPKLEKRKPDLEQYLSIQSGHQVRIESLHAYWDGLHPGAQLKGMHIQAPDASQSPVALSEVRVSLALLPMLWGKLEINSLVIVNPSLVLERMPDRRFRISGFNSPQATQNGGGEKFVGWLFQQNRIQIENGELQWIDHIESDQPLHFSRVNLSLRNSGSRHRLGISADFPPQMCRACSFDFDIQGNPLVSSDWDGDIHLRAGEVDVVALPLIVREKLPAAFRGKFDVQLWTEWEQGSPVLVRGNLRVSELRLPLPGMDMPLAIREAAGELSWKMRRDGWRLDVSNPLIGLSGPAWAAGHLRIEHQPDENQIQVKHLDVGDITGFLLRLKSNRADATEVKSSALLDYWLTAQPVGLADNFSLRVNSKGDAPDEFSLETDIRAVAALPYQKYPGAQGLSGHLVLSQRTGSLQIDSGKTVVLLPTIFRESLALQQLRADLAWEQHPDYWQIDGKNLSVISEDVQGTGKLSLRVPLDKSVSPDLKLRVDFHDGNGAHAARYFPAPHLKPSTLAWMERSFLGGEITRGYFIFEGPIHDFPFRQQTGKFELRGHVRQATYNFLPGWEPVRQAEVDVVINGPDVLVTGSGKLGGLNASQVVVHSREDSEGNRSVQVQAKAAGAVNDALKILRAAKSAPGTGHWLSFVPAGIQGAGEGALNLDLTIPLRDPHATTIAGDYRFLKGALRLTGKDAAGVAAEDIEGSVRFTEAGIYSGALRARVLGGETVLAAAHVGDQLRIRGEGEATALGMAPLLGARIAARVTGGVKWNVTGQWNQGIANVSAEADLRNLKLSLPPPLDWPQGLMGGKLLIRTESSAENNITLGLGVDRRFSGRLSFARTAEGWDLARGRIGFGDVRATTEALSNTSGLYLSAKLDAVDVDQWRPWLSESTGSGTTPAWLTRISADVNAFDVLGRQFGNLSFDVIRNGDVWRGSIDGTSAAGRVKFSGQGRTASYEIDLARLTLPDKKPDAPSGGGNVDSDPRNLPAVTLRSKSFQWRDKQLGALDFAMTPNDSGVRIDRLNFARPEMKLNVSGDWKFINNNHASTFIAELSSTDIGKTMEALGMPGQVSGGEVSVKSHLAWPGTPVNIKLATLDGDVELSAKKGRFLQVKPGAGRLFGLLDLSAVGRYLTLDFSPVFGKGLIYNQIDGKINIEKGNARARHFSIEGPAMQIDVAGRIGLAAEDFDLAIELQPKLSDSVTIATWGVWGPQVAAVALAVQKIFKKQIAAGTRITYVVKGPWDNPAITKQEKNSKASSPAKADDAGVVQ